ncbi:MAG: DNA primase [Candidatus Paceibacterota bacterium]|jgi:DNA primase
MDSPIEEIKNRLNIVEVIGGYIKLQKAGANWRACCPFHNEKSPSFFVSPSRQIWHCFGCNKGGDVFAFIKEIDGVEFGDALRTLAHRAGVELKPQSPEWQNIKTERQNLQEICGLACRFYETQLEKSKVGQEARKYLLERGMSEESIAKWRLGFAPDAWQGLSDFLVGRGFKREDAGKAGLAVRNNGGNFYDRFRGRIMFPVFDINSQVVGFGGRVFGDSKNNSEQAKYINISNTLLYDKSRILYGLDKAKVEIRKKDACILVEGYMDCILSHQAGVSNVVAASGTALTPWHLNLLSRYSQNLILSFDMDTGGNEASKRGIDLAQKEGFNIRMTIMPEGKDPADVMVDQGNQAWQDICEKAKPVIEYYFNLAFTGRDPAAISEKKAIAQMLLPEIKKISNKIEQNFWLDELSKKLKVRHEDLEEEMKKIKMETAYLPSGQNDPSRSEKAKPPEHCQKSRKELLEEELLTFILADASLIEKVPQETIEMFVGPAKDIFLKIISEPQITQADLQKSFESSEQISKFLGEIFLRSDIEKETVESIEKCFDDCLNQTEKLHGLEAQKKLTSQIKDAEQSGDSEKLKDLLSHYNIAVKKSNK